VEARSFNDTPFFAILSYFLSSGLYSVRSDFTGFAIAPLTACTLTVTTAGNKVIKPVAGKMIRLIVVS